jgi:Response regulator receiver domain
VSTRPIALVIDNYDDTREVYAEVLRLEGFRVEGASDGREALQKAVELLPDIIITDLYMPIMDGWETIRRLRADERTRRFRSSRVPVGKRRVPRTTAGRMYSWPSRARWTLCCSKFGNCFAGPPDPPPNARPSALVALSHNAGSSPRFWRSVSHSPTQPRCIRKARGCSSSG